MSKALIKDFKYLQGRLETRLRGWRSKSLSQANRCTLIKSVAQTIPTYSMTTFDIPTKICDSMDALTRRFWWKLENTNGRYLAWRAQDKLCQPKSKGGLGFKKTKAMNKAVVSKLAWMVVSKRDNFSMNVLRCKYKVRSDWLRKDPPKKASSIWKPWKNQKLSSQKVLAIWLVMWTPIMFEWTLGFLGYLSSNQNLRVQTLSRIHLWFQAS